MLKLDTQAVRSAWARAAVYLLVLLIAASIYKIRKTLFVFVVAIMFSYLVYPLVELLHRRLWWRSRTAALLIPFVSLICLADWGGNKWSEGLLACSCPN